MNVPRKLALASTTLVAATALTSCGFNYATDRVYTPAAGINDTTGNVDILNAAIVSAQANSGTFVASFSNNDTTKTIKFTGMSGDGSAVGVVNAKPFSLAPGGFRNLSTSGGVPLTGTFSSGQMVTVSLTFDDGETANLDVPVVNDTGQWAGLDTSPPAASSSASPTASPSS